jgi:hypothetical protein
MVHEMNLWDTKPDIAYEYTVLLSQGPIAGAGNEVSPISTQGIIEK